MPRRKWQIEWYSTRSDYHDLSNPCFTRWGARRLADCFNRAARQRDFGVRARAVPRP